MKTNKLFKIFTLIVIPVLFYFILAGFNKVGEINVKTSSQHPVVRAEPKDFTTLISNFPMFDKMKTTPDMKATFENTDLSRLCYGQRIVYEVTGKDAVNKTSNVFCYRHCKGEYLTDEGRTVLHARTSVNPAGYLCYGINESHGKNNSLLNTDNAEFTSRFIKPVMRIAKEDFNNSDTRPVVSVSVYNPEGERVDSVTIRVRNFSDLNGNYDGEYKDNYLFEVIMDNLRIANNKLAETPGGKSKISFNDIKIYWFGLVDVWFDKVIIDDEIANVLLNNNMCSNYDEKIYDETNITNFYTICKLISYKQFSYANTDCVNYVLNKMYDKLQNQAQQITLK